MIVWNEESISAWRARLESWRWLKVPALLFVSSRASIYFVSHWSMLLDPRSHLGGEPLRDVIGLCRWDCGWFMEIASHGYAQQKYSNFFPLFPLLGRAAHALTGLRYDHALTLIANVAGFVGLAAVYRVFSQLEGEEVAAMGTALLVAWPFSFFQAAPYPESLMLASSALAILWSERNQHFRAGIALGLGILARHLTVFAGGALVVAHVRQRGLRPGRLIADRRFLALLLPLAIAGTYPAYLYFRFGDPLVWLKVRQEWGEVAWFGLVRFFRSRWWQTHFATYVWLSLVPGIGALWLLRNRRHWILAGYAVPLMACLWLVGLAGLGRYTQAVWPAFLPIAIAISKRPSLKLPTVIAFSTMQGLFLYLYVHWYWIN